MIGLTVNGDSNTWLCILCVPCQVNMYTNSSKPALSNQNSQQCVVGVNEYSPSPKLLGCSINCCYTGYLTIT